MQLKRKNQLSKRCFILFVFFLLPFTGGAVPDIDLQTLTFRLNDKEGMAEVSLYCVGSTLTCTASPDDEYGIEYTVFIKDTLGNFVNGERYRLTQKGACPARDIFDLKRFRLSDGWYIIEVETNDIHEPDQKLTLKNIVHISTAAHLSDLQLLAAVLPDVENTSSLAKSGIIPEPLGFLYYHPKLTRSIVYLETYNTDQLSGTPYIQYAIHPVNGTIPAPIISYKMLVPQPTQPLLLNLDISELISGEYLYEVTLFRDKDIPVEKKSMRFTRANPVGDSLYVENFGSKMEESFASLLSEDSLNYYLRAIAPIVPNPDVEILNALVKTGSAKSKRFFLHRYWTQTGGKFASIAFNKYMEIARKVDESFRSGFGYGFETDRGHIFLKYGRPFDNIIVEDEPSAPPYEIWFYDYFPATGQQNVRFLFYNPDLIKNGHKLLHSTARGEVSNPRWEVILYKDATLETPGINSQSMGDNVHRNARQYFEK